MSPVSILAVSASVLNLTGYAWYIRDLVRGTTRPNVSSWMVWMGVTVVSVSSYVAATGDPVKSIFSWSILAANIITFFFIIRRARFSTLSRLDVWALCVGIAAAVAWAFTKSAWWGNMLIQIAIVTGGIPTYFSVWRNPSNERPWPWLLWGAAFICQTLVIVTKWTGQPLELVYPIIGILLYAGIGLLALRKSAPISENRP
ncbi:MAG TPA: hypothetical protein VJ553_01510 [Candidatus Paceibacterota bacterium]|nr:hypothetical protein [Candidatus Paceibacterota bacterium]